MKSIDLNPQFAKILASVESPSDFLRQADHLIQEYPAFSYAHIARRAGFSSRSFVRSVFKGTRNLTRESVPQFARGLKLSRQLEKGVFLLMDLHKSCDEKRPKLKSRLENLAKKVENANGPRPQNFKYQNWPFVYAALGDSQTGNALDEICRLTGKSITEVMSILHDMIKQDIVEHRNNRFFPKANFLDIDQLSGDNGYKRFFDHSLSMVRQRLPDEIKSRDSLFFISTFSVKQSQLSEITLRLQSLLMEFSENVEDASGDKLVLLEAALVEPIFQS